MTEYMQRTVSDHLTSEQQDEIASLTEQELHDFAPKEHSAVQALDARISDLNAEVQRVNEKAEKRTAARAALKEAKKAHTLGDAPETDVTAAREQLNELRKHEHADDEETDVEAAREAIQELKERRKSVLRIVQRLYRDRCTEVYETLIFECEPPIRRLLDIRERVHTLDRSYKRRGGDPHSTQNYSPLHQKNGKKRTRLPSFPIPEPGAHHPSNRPIMLSVLNKWLREWGRE